MQIAAPAKINLNLRVVGRNDATGYHDIETWMAPVSLADELRVEFTETPGITLTCSDPELGSGSGNLAWKAADLFLRETKHPGGGLCSQRASTQGTQPFEARSTHPRARQYSSRGSKRWTHPRRDRKGVVSGSKGR